MVIETEYNIGDEVYTLYKNKVTKTKIKAVDVLVSTDITVKYNSDIVEGLFESNKVFMEKDLFKTKEELLKSL